MPCYNNLYIITTQLLRHYDVRLTDGAWSESKPSVFYTTRADGCLDSWDILQRQTDPIITIQVWKLYNIFWNTFFLCLTRRQILTKFICLCIHKKWVWMSLFILKCLIWQVNRCLLFNYLIIWLHYSHKYEFHFKRSCLL